MVRGDSVWWQNFSYWSKFFIVMILIWCVAFHWWRFDFSDESLYFSSFAFECFWSFLCLRIWVCWSCSAAEAGRIGQLAKVLGNQQPNRNKRIDFWRLPRQCLVNKCFAVRDNNGRQIFKQYVSFWITHTFSHFFRAINYKLLGVCCLNPSVIARWKKTLWQFFARQEQLSGW